MNSVFTTKMKCAVVSTLMSLAFVFPASGLLRPLFPIKPTAPSNGELIVIEDDLVLRSAKKLPMRFHRHRSARRLQQRPAFFALERCVRGAIGDSHRSTAKLAQTNRYQYCDEAYAIIDDIDTPEKKRNLDEEKVNEFLKKCAPV